jgi:hypothetical protein
MAMTKTRNLALEPTRQLTTRLNDRFARGGLRIVDRTRRLRTNLQESTDFSAAAIGPSTGDGRRVVTQCRKLQQLFDFYSAERIRRIRREKEGVIRPIARSFVRQCNQFRYTHHVWLDPSFSPFAGSRPSLEPGQAILHG